MIETERLILRTWKKEDVTPYFQINQHPKMSEFLRGPLTITQVNDFILRVNHHQVKHGYTVWAAELKKTGELIGSIGLYHVDWQSHFTPAVEIMWRLGVSYWGKGYGEEGAKAALEYGFKQCNLTEIVSFAVRANVKSIRLMEKIGLKYDVQGDFAHPEFDPDHQLSTHVLYRLSAEVYMMGHKNEH